MNYLCALQRKSNGRWDYSRNSVPCGYCRRYVPIPEDGKVVPIEIASAENARMLPLIGNFHVDGHATKEEACECYKRYLLDTRLRLRPEEPADASQQNRYEVCRKFTACHASVGPYRMFMLCPEHQTREHVASLLKVGESWES